MDDLIEDEQMVSPDVKALLAVPGTDPLDIHRLLQVTIASSHTIVQSLKFKGHRFLSCFGTV